MAGMYSGMGNQMWGRPHSGMSGPGCGPGPGYAYGPGFGYGMGYGFGGPMTMTGTYPGPHGPYGGQGFVPGFGQGFGQGFGPGYGPGFYGPASYGQMGAMPTDDEISDMITESIDADPAVPYDSDISIDVTGGIVTLTGTVPNKRIKHSIGDDAWWVPGVWDVNNQLQVSGRREKTGESAARGQGMGSQPGAPQRRMSRRPGQSSSRGQPYGQY